MNLLVITNPDLHSNTDSLYGILNYLNNNSDLNIFISPVTNKINTNLISTNTCTSILCKKIDSEFLFNNIKTWFLELNEMKTCEAHKVLMMADGLTEFNRTHINKNLLSSDIYNNPIGITKTSNKKFLLNLQDFTPDIKIVRKLTEIVGLINTHNEIVLKPLNSNKGNGLIRINKEFMFFENKKVLFKDGLMELEVQFRNHEYLAMRFLNKLEYGDKRIVVVNGQVVATVLRTPKKDSWLCNVDKGASYTTDVSVTEEENNMVEAVSSIVKKEGIIIFGIDTLVDDETGLRILSEINTSNVGGVITENSIKKWFNAMITDLTSLN